MSPSAPLLVYFSFIPFSATFTAICKRFYSLIFFGTILFCKISKLFSYIHTYILVVQRQTKYYSLEVYFFHVKCCGIFSLLSRLYFKFQLTDVMKFLWCVFVVVFNFPFRSLCIWERLRKRDSKRYPRE